MNPPARVAPDQGIGRDGRTIEEVILSIGLWSGYGLVVGFLVTFVQALVSAVVLSTSRPTAEVEEGVWAIFFFGLIYIFGFAPTVLVGLSAGYVAGGILIVLARKTVGERLLVRSIGGSIIGVAMILSVSYYGTLLWDGPAAWREIPWLYAIVGLLPVVPAVATAPFARRKRAQRSGETLTP